MSRKVVWGQVRLSPLGYVAKAWRYAEALASRKSFIPHRIYIGNPRHHRFMAMLLVAIIPCFAHDPAGRSIAPPASRLLKNPLHDSVTNLTDGASLFSTLCTSCHGLNGKLDTNSSTNLISPMFAAMRDGEIYWIISNGVPSRMPAFSSKLSEIQRWQLTLHLRHLQKEVEIATPAPYKWDLPPGFPVPAIPADNQISVEKAALGRLLFYDKRLSLNQNQSCGTCHQQARAFTDGRPFAIGSTSEIHPRGSMSIVNAAYNSVFTWANPNLRHLEDQALVALFVEHPIELGLSGKEDILMDRLQSDANYQQLFNAAFPADLVPFSIKNITRAIASFERTIISGNSPYDHYKRGTARAISTAAKRGETLFFSERLACFHCHGGFNFTASISNLGKEIAPVEFHNNGLQAEPQPKRGLYEFTRRPEDIGRFKAPTLRNIALTAPYMHDGSLPTLSAVIDHYKSGGRKNSNQSEFIKSIQLSKREKADLTAFLSSLTDQTILHDQSLADPFTPHAATPGLPPDSIEGEIVAIYAADKLLIVDCEVVPPLMDMPPGHRMEFDVANVSALKGLKPGQRITGTIRKLGDSFLVENIHRRRP